MVKMVLVYSGNDAWGHSEIKKRVFKKNLSTIYTAVRRSPRQGKGFSSSISSCDLVLDLLCPVNKVASQPSACFRFACYILQLRARGPVCIRVPSVREA